MADRHGLIVDYGGVLTTDVFASFRAFCEAEGLPPDTVRDRFRNDPETRALLAGLETGSLAVAEFEPRFAALLEVASERLIERLVGGMAPDEAMLDGVRTARRAGVRTGLLSNSWGDATTYEPALLRELFDAWVISSEVGLRKPAIERARAQVATLGLENVRFELADLTALPSLGEFDYVVAHGVYSWIEPAARDALLAACREHLAPRGVAYISYDVLPGGHLREITRQMLRWHLRAVDEPEERIAQARALLAAIVEARPEGDEMHLVAQRALRQADPSIFHDELAPHHEAVLFTDFVAHAAAHGLRFLAEADVFEMEAGGLPPGLAEDPIEREQYPDFFKGRMFRQTLLCQAGAELREGGVEVVRGMLAATPARPVDESDGRVEFRGPSGASLTTDHDGVKAALKRLGEAWPAALPVAELGDDPAVAETLRRAYAANIVRLHVWAPELTTTLSERPVASALARLKAAEGTHVTTLLHTTVDVGDETGLRLIRLLDGTRDRASLVAELDRPADELERSLEGLARIGLLER